MKALSECISDMLHGFYILKVRRERGIFVKKLAKHD